MNTRDMMTDLAITGDNICFDALERAGWGESGERYVRLNRAEQQRLMQAEKGENHG